MRSLSSFGWRCWGRVRLPISCQFFIGRSVMWVAPGRLGLAQSSMTVAIDTLVCVARGSPPGPRLPRKGTATKRSREAIEGVAFQIGVMVAIERNRWKVNQYELSQKIGTDQISISNIENGKPTGATDRQIDALFNALDLKDAKVQASFLKWWRDNG